MTEKHIIRYETRPWRAALLTAAIAAAALFMPNGSAGAQANGQVLPAKPASWKDIFFPDTHALPGS